MPPRDEHDYEQRRQQIIDGALEVFASRGFYKATNKDIAEAAGIGSPGLIYHYFKDKKDLFRQVIEQRAPHMQLLMHIEDFMALPPREALTLFGRTFLQVLEDRRFVMSLKLILSDLPRNPDILETLNDVGPGRWLPIFRRYLERQMDAGTLRRMDSGAAARCFVGPLIVYIITRELLPQPDARTLSPEAMIESAIEVFMHGMQVDQTVVRDQE